MKLSSIRKKFIKLLSTGAFKVMAQLEAVENKCSPSMRHAVRCYAKHCFYREAVEYVSDEINSAMGDCGACKNEDALREKEYRKRISDFSRTSGMSLTDFISALRSTVGDKETAFFIINDHLQMRAHQDLYVMVMEGVFVDDDDTFIY